MDKKFGEEEGKKLTRRMLEKMVKEENKINKRV